MRSLSGCRSLVATSVALAGHEDGGCFAGLVAKRMQDGEECAVAGKNPKSNGHDNHGKKDKSFD